MCFTFKEKLPSKEDAPTNCGETGMPLDERGWIPAWKFYRAPFIGTLDTGVLSPSIFIISAGCKVESIDMGVSGGGGVFLLVCVA